MAKIISKFIGFILNIISLFSPKYAVKKAFQLFTSPRKGKPNEVESDFLNTAFQEELNYNGLDIMTYRWLGKNKTILLAHGWESNASRWKFLINQLRQSDYNIIALDAPAHGYSKGKEFNAILYSECINVVANRFNPSIIIGHSVGGMASVFFQNKYKFQELEKIILLGTPSEFTGVLKRYVIMMGYNKRIENSITKLVFERFNHLPSYYSGANFAKEINTKTLIIHDKKDEIIPFSDALLYKNNFKNPQLIATSNLGHSLRQK